MCFDVINKKAMDYNTRNILQEARYIAVVGCSGDPGKAAHNVPLFLKEQGYHIIPINPNHLEILGQTCYPNLRSLPKDEPVDVVEIFRPPEETATIVRHIIKWARETGRNPVIWTQLGVSSAEAEELARKAGFTYVRNRCMKIEFRQVESELEA